ncbi:MAG: four-carbon acid sugar kinase family protein [Spirochaetales bacterium]|jgi:uncharacterized protein YgbK (DUF1537 family)|nr:four-carbon acid sugar kinase family protein [Spirochaetales bacterium]
MVKLLVVADDLTGALDTGVQLAKKGIPTEVRIAACGVSGEDTRDTAVVVIDTESRHLPADEAFARVRDAALWGKAAGAAGFYKKTDSTLRGNIGAELAGFMEGCPQNTPLIFAPAFPALKRTTRLGVQYVDGVSLEKTAFARDRLNPITTANIAEIIKTGSAALKVSCAAPEQLAGVLVSRAPEKTVTVVDGENEEDLAETSRRIRAAVSGAGGCRPLPLMAGCAGFAAYLPELLELTAAQTPRPQLTPPLLAVNGSLNPVSLAQTRAALAAGASGVRLKPAALSCASFEESLARELAECSAKAKAAVLHNILDAGELDAYIREAQLQGIADKDLHTVLPQACGRILLRLAKDTDIGALVVFGGDTLVGILNVFGKNSVVPLEEIFPGVVLARIPGVENPRHIITKAGGFGSEDLLQKLLGLGSCCA